MSIMPASAQRTPSNNELRMPSHLTKPDSASNAKFDTKLAAPFNFPAMKYSMDSIRVKKDVRMERKDVKPRPGGAILRALKKIDPCTSCKSVKKNFEEDITTTIASTINDIIPPPYRPEENIPCITTAPSKLSDTKIIMAMHAGETPRQSYFAELEERKHLVLDRVRERREAIAFVKQCLETHHPDTYANMTVDTGFGSVSVTPREDKDMESNDFNPAFAYDQDIERAMNVNRGRMDRYAHRYGEVSHPALGLNVEVDLGQLYATYKADSHVIVNTKQDIVQKSLDVVEKLAQHGITHCDVSNLPERPYGTVLDMDVFLSRYECNDNGEPLRHHERDVYALGYPRFKTFKALEDIEEDFAVSAEHEVSPIITSPPLSGSGQSTPAIQTPAMDGFADAEVVINDSGSPDEEHLSAIDSQRGHCPIASDEKQAGVGEQLRPINRTSHRRYAIHWDFEQEYAGNPPPPLPVGSPPRRPPADQHPSVNLLARTNEIKGGQT